MRLCSLVAVSAVVIGQAAASGQAGYAAVRKEIEQQNGHIIQALKDGNTKGMLEACTSDFTWKLPEGAPLLRQKGEVAFRLLLTSRHVADMTLNITKLTPSGADMEATIAAKEVIELQDRDGKYVKKNGRVRLTSTRSERQTWTKTPQGMRLKRWEEFPGGKTTSVEIPAAGGPASSGGTARR